MIIDQISLVLFLVFVLLFIPFLSVLMLIQHIKNNNIEVNYSSYQQNIMHETKYMFPKRIQKNSKDKHNMNSLSSKCLTNNNIKSNSYVPVEFHIPPQVSKHKNTEIMSRIQSEKSITSPNCKRSNISPQNPKSPDIFSSNYNNSAIKNKNGLSTMFGFYKPANSNNVAKNSEQKVLYSQRLEITGNISLLDNPQSRFSKYNSLIAFQPVYSKKNNFKQIQSFIQKQQKPQLNKIKSQQSLEQNMPQSKPTTKFYPTINSNIDSKYYKHSKYNLASTITLKSKNRSKTIINKQKQKIQKGDKVKGQDNEFMSQLKISDIQCMQLDDREQQLVTTQTKRVSQNSTSRNDISDIRFPQNHRSKQNKTFSKERNFIRQANYNRLSCNFQFKDLIQQKKLLKQKLHSLEVKFVEKQQRVKLLEKQLDRYRKIKKQYSQDEEKQNQYDNHQTKQHQIEKKCLRQQILLLKMANKKLEMHYDVHDKQIEQLKKKLQEKQRRQLQISKQLKNQQYFKRHATDSIHVYQDQNKSSVIIKNDLSNDFDPLQGVNFELYDIKNQNEHLSQLLRKAEDEIQRLRIHNRKLRQENDRYLSMKKIQIQPQDKYYYSSKISNQSNIKQENNILQCYTEVLKLFGISLNENQLSQCHSELMNQIDFFKKSLMDLLEKLRKSQDHKLLISQELEKVKKTKLQQEKAQANANSEQKYDVEEVKPILKKQDFQKLLSSLNERIKNLQPQLDNKFNDLIKRLYKIIKTLRQKFGHQVEQIFVKLIREDEVLAYYARF